MFNLVERRLAIVTPKEAAEILAERNTYCGQRPRRQSHVDYLAAKMREGLFHSAEIAYAKLPDGRWAIGNGQHTLAASVQSGVPFNASIYGYECQNENDLFLLYSEIDRGMRRSQVDITRAGRQIMPSRLQEIGSGAVGMFGAAILMAPDGDRPAVFRSRAITPQNRVMAVCANPDEALFMYRYYGGLLLNRIAIRMAMVATFRADAERARMFWDGVVDSNHLPASDPRSRLHLLLLNKQLRRNSAVAVRELYIRCLDHWNALATGGEVPEYDGNRTVMALKPTAPLPTLATVRIAPRPSAPQVFTAATPAVTAMQKCPTPASSPVAGATA